MLARIFIQLGLIEQTGHGVLLVVDKYDKDVFEFLDNFLRVSIPYSRQLKVADKVADKLSDNHKKILDLIKQNPNITVTEISKITAFSDSGIRKMLALLKSAGIIKRVGSNKTGHWEIIE